MIKTLAIAGCKKICDERYTLHVSRSHVRTFQDVNSELGTRNSRTIRTFCIFITALLLVSCTNPGGRQATEATSLTPCSADGSVFADTAFNQWKNIYHNNVSTAIEAHLTNIKNTGTQPLRCTEEEYANLVPASPQLRSIANMLPAWRENPGDAAGLSEADMGTVLLEFLRIYECSMKERELYHSVRILQDADRDMNPEEFQQKKSEELKVMQNQIEVSRKTLNRTLSIVAGYDRFKPLTLDIECIKRASLDLRNVLGLASDASSCLPRIWDVHQSLRDLQP